MTFPSRRWAGCESNSTLRALRLCVRLLASGYARASRIPDRSRAAGFRNGLVSVGLTLSARFGFRNRFQSTSLIVPGIAQRPMRVDSDSIQWGEDPER